jgi:hypothetical protein
VRHFLPKPHSISGRDKGDRAIAANMATAMFDRVAVK